MRRPRSVPEFQFDLSGGTLSLDFVNTLSRRDSPERRTEHLNDYNALVDFSQQTGLIAPRRAAELKQYASRHAAEARRVLLSAIKLREVLFRLYAAIAASKNPPAEALQAINIAAQTALTHRELARLNGGYGWRWISNRKNQLASILWPIAVSASELLTSNLLGKVRECEAPDCVWLFLDQSRNRSRRWCDMTSCGNREKARRHYHRENR